MEPPANRPPITEQHQWDQSGSINFNPTYHWVSLMTETTIAQRSLQPKHKVRLLICHIIAWWRLAVFAVETLHSYSVLYIAWHLNNVLLHFVRLPRGLIFFIQFFIIVFIIIIISIIVVVIVIIIIIVITIATIDIIIVIIIIINISTIITMITIALLPLSLLLLSSWMNAIMKIITVLKMYNNKITSTWYDNKSSIT